MDRPFSTELLVTTYLQPLITHTFREYNCSYGCIARSTTASVTRGVPTKSKSCKPIVNWPTYEFVNEIEDHSISLSSSTTSTQTINPILFL